MLLTNFTTPTKTLLALATGIALILSGCTVNAKQVTNVTVSSATLNAEVSCGSGSVYWQLRETGQSQWRTVSGQPTVPCPRGVGGAPAPRTAQVSAPVTGLRANAGYEFRVGIDPPGEMGVVYSQASRFTTGGGGGTRPVVVPASGGAPATLRMGSPAGPRMQLRGVNVWGLQDSITTSFGASQYANRGAIASTIKSWGGNVVRFRVLADDYNKAPSAATGGLTKAQIIQRIKDWRDAVVSRGMYFMPCSWDALDGAYSDAAWAGNGSRVHQMFADIRHALGDDPMVVYEVTNEPNNVSWDAWNANMQGSIKFFRETLGYRGLLVIDPIWWANSGTGGQGYDDGRYSALEAYDAARPGMSSHQLAFAKHDYANGYAGKTWNGGAWAGAQGGAQTKHLIFETEFGNYNGAPSTVSDAWAAGAASFFRSRFASQPNYVGAAAFLFGPWFDANAMTGANNSSTTAWGASVRSRLLGG